MDDRRMASCYRRRIVDRDDERQNYGKLAVVVRTIVRSQPGAAPCRNGYAEFARRRSANSGLLRQRNGAVTSTCHAKRS